MRDDDVLSGWATIVDRIVRGEQLPRQKVVVGATPDLLQRYGLGASSLSMSVAKLARCRREHPEVPLAVWHRLPELLEQPLAIFPSRRRDRSLVILLVVVDRDGSPVLVAVTPDGAGGPKRYSVGLWEGGGVGLGMALDRARADRRSRPLCQ